MIPNDSIDFYPTPDDLADDMIRALRASNDGSGLSYLPCSRHRNIHWKERKLPT